MWMWTLRRMKILDVDPSTICDVYTKEIRSLLELAVAWHSGLTCKQSADIERLQKGLVQVILSNCKTGISDFTYDMAMASLDLEPLETRRKRLCLGFAKKSLKSRHSDIFSKNLSQYETRGKPVYHEETCNTKRYYNSPLNYLTRLLNSKK